MKNLKGLLERFSNSLNKDALLREKVREIIFKQSKVDLKTENIVAKEGVLTLKAGSSAKNEIKFKEERILNELKKKNIRIRKILYK